MKNIRSFWLLEVPEKLLNWFVSPRNFGFKLAAFGLLLLGIPNAINWAIQIVGQYNGSIVNLQIASSEMPSWLTVGFYIFGSVFLLFGLGVAIWQYFYDRKIISRKRIFAVEFRGMVDTTDTPLVNAIQGFAMTQRDEILFDVRENIQRGTLDEISIALAKIERLPERLKEKSIGRDRSDIAVYTGALMPVPLQFYAGFIFDDQAPLTLMDWRRDEGKWCHLDLMDDNERFQISQIPDSIDTEVVLAVSASYLVDYKAIKTCFPNCIVVKLALKTPLVNSLWSEEKQQALSQQFLITVGKLSNLGVKRIHLVLAASSSLCLRFGTLYDDRNFPEVIVYQYEKTNQCPYPWGVLMPTHGIKKPNVIKL